VETSWILLAVAGGSLAFALGLLLGVWIGLRISTRDAALLGVLDRRVATALTKSADAETRAAQLEAAWVEQLERVETNRRRSAAERQRAEEARAKIEEANAEPAQTRGALPDALQGAERRRAIARLGRGAA
jgi:hypothetical protein